MSSFMNYKIFSLFFVGLFLISFSLTPLVKRAALRLGLVDKPDGDSLKIHRHVVPLGGGAVLILPVVMGLLTFPFLLTEKIISLVPIMAIGAGALLVFGIGLIDDFSRVRPGIRLVVHVLAAVGVSLFAGKWSGILVLTAVTIGLATVAIAVTINAFNMSDGMDGLCAGLSLISCIGFFFWGFKQDHALLMAIAAVSFISLLGFIPYNLYPARIFLGDAGSGLLGFLIGTMMILGLSCPPIGFGNLIAVVLIAGLPVFDMGLAVGRRIARGKPLFTGDRDHIYDLLLKKNWSQPKVWMSLCAIQTGFVIFSLKIQ